MCVRPGRTAATEGAPSGLVPGSARLKAGGVGANNRSSAATMRRTYAPGGSLSPKVLGEAHPSTSIDIRKETTSRATVWRNGKGCSRSAAGPPPRGIPRGRQADDGSPGATRPPGASLREADPGVLRRTPRWREDHATYGRAHSTAPCSIEQAGSAHGHHTRLRSQQPDRLRHARDPGGSRHLGRPAEPEPRVQQRPRCRLGAGRAHGHGGRAREVGRGARRRRGPHAALHAGSPTA